MEIVAEFTYNHLGDAERAGKMIDAAKTAGATCVKFELRNNEKYFRNYPALVQQKERYEFTNDMLAGFIAHCKGLGLGWFASVHDLSSLKRVLPFKPRYIKIASREARLIPFVRQVKEINTAALPVIISTGGLSFTQVEEVYELMKDDDLMLLHTSCLYPCEVEDLNMNRIIMMKQKFNCKVGYSGHERGIVPSLYASTLGIVYIERHFTLEDESAAVAKGHQHFKDELCTLGPTAFKEMVDAVMLFAKLQKQPFRPEVLHAELNRVNAYGVPAWSGEDVYVS